MSETYDPNADPTKMLIDYNKLVQNIPSEWRETHGKNINIGIIDSGMTRNHPDFLNYVTSVNSFDFTQSPNSINDIANHGTGMAGIIGARSTNLMGIRGVASECNIFFLKAADDSGDFSTQSLKDVIAWLTKNNIHIVNCSFSISYPKYQKLFTDWNTLRSIVVAAAGENETLTGSNYFYPAMNNNFISVGTIDHLLSSPFNPQLNYIMPLPSIISCSNNPNNWYNPLSGSSPATAFMTGIIALYLSFTNSMLVSKKTITTVLDAIAIPYDQNIEFGHLSIIKPKELLS
ncbi:MAG TPA: S8/S53 family peptidase [Bacteroidota bacterium]|nr:S8/S53 family peptidase [Bacteroidota bacterium]